MSKKNFPGGVHPNDGKAITNSIAIRKAPLLKEYIVPLSQHIGAPAKCIVEVGQHVLRGEKIAEAGGFVSVPIHAPTSGEVVGITKASKDPVNSITGPTGAMIPAVTIVSDGEDKAAEPLTPINWETASVDELKARVLEAGVVGMGGAAFPTHVKLSPPPGKNIDTLIINAAECEPFLTADHRQMLEYAEQIITGTKIIQKILGVENVYIGIENNKQDAIELMQKTAGDAMKVVGLRTIYPQGSEKQLIYSLTGRKVPTANLPMEAGCVVQNSGTAFAIYEAIVDGKPLYERVTTITGSPVVDPGNWWLRVGTPLKDALTMAKGVKDPNDVGKIILGGPIMGFAQSNLDVPVMKNCSGILLIPRNEVFQYEENPCIRCSRCIEACPMDLMPSTMGVQIEKERFDMAEETDVMDCIECGCCSYVCPTNRPLVQLFRRGKAAVNANRRKQS